MKITPSPISDILIIEPDTYSDERASVLYKTIDYWNPKSEYCIRWDDPTLAIDWPKSNFPPILSTKDFLGVAWLDSPKIS